MWVKSLNHMKGWTTGLALKMRPKVIRKWPNRETQWASARTWLKHDSDKQRYKETKINSVWRSFWYCSVNHFWFLHILSCSVQKPQVRARSTTNQEIKTFCGKFRRVELKKPGGGDFFTQTESKSTSCRPSWCKKIRWSNRVSFHEMMFGQQGKDKWASHVKPERATEAKLIMLCYDKERRCIRARRMVNLIT